MLVPWVTSTQGLVLQLGEDVLIVAAGNGAAAGELHLGQREGVAVGPVADRPGKRDCVVVDRFLVEIGGLEVGRQVAGDLAPAIADADGTDLPEGVLGPQVVVQAQRDLGVEKRRRRSPHENCPDIDGRHHGVGVWVPVGGAGNDRLGHRLVQALHPERPCHDLLLTESEIQGTDAGTAVAEILVRGPCLVALLQGDRLLFSRSGQLRTLSDDLLVDASAFHNQRAFRNGQDQGRYAHYEERPVIRTIGEAGRSDTHTDFETVGDKAAGGPVESVGGTDGKCGHTGIDSRIASEGAPQRMLEKGVEFGPEGELEGQTASAALADLDQVRDLGIGPQLVADDGIDLTGQVFRSQADLLEGRRGGRYPEGDLGDKGKFCFRGIGNGHWRHPSIGHEKKPPWAAVRSG